MDTTEMTAEKAERIRKENPEAYAKLMAEHGPVLKAVASVIKIEVLSRIVALEKANKLLEARIAAITSNQRRGIQ